MGHQRMAKNSVGREKNILNKRNSVNRAHGLRYSIGTADRSRGCISAICGKLLMELG